MVFESSSYTMPSEPVMWDLRQFYVEWTRGYMASFSQAHFADDYLKMYKALQKWHSVIWGRSIKDFVSKNEEVNKDKMFEELMDAIVRLSNDEKHTRTFLMKERDAESVEKLDKAFSTVVIYLIWLMKKNKLFGSDTINRGLT